MMLYYLLQEDEQRKIKLFSQAFLRFNVKEECFCQEHFLDLSTGIEMSFISSQHRSPLPLTPQWQTLWPPLLPIPQPG